MAGEIITLGTIWGYKPEVCDTCEHLEENSPEKIEDRMVACKAPNYRCIKNGRIVYPYLASL